jgi:hypothetical protein
LTKVARLQMGLLEGIKKMTSPSLASRSGDQQDDVERSTSHHSGMESQSYPVEHFYPDQQPEPKPVDYSDPFNSAYFDGSTNFGYLPGQQLPVDGWLWDMVVNDGNMFTM